MRRKEVRRETGQDRSAGKGRPLGERVDDVQMDYGGRVREGRHDGESVATLASRLADPQVRSSQRNAIAAELGRSLGNRALARLLETGGAADLVQRSQLSDSATLGLRSPSELDLEKPAQDKLSNSAVRQWYLKRVALIPFLNQLWLALGMSAEERAREAYDHRHQARLQARTMMADRVALKLLQARDTKKYGNPNGPTFEWLVKQYQAQGLKGDAVYEAIVHGASKTDPKTNRRFGVSGKEQ